MPPVVSLPKGGGAIKGMGEKFAANPVTGTGSLIIPVPLSPGRSGFTPTLALAYDSGAGNGPYGFGWTVSYPSISRRTDRGLPRYRDDLDSDVFLLSGSDDLVPEVHSDGSRFEQERLGYRVRCYRPRIEGLFARIECWTSIADPADTFWRSISRDNITTFYGKDSASRICDPGDPGRIFSWLLCETYDDKGNAAVYEYVAEDGRNVDARMASEANRTAASRSANRYLKRVKYANRTSRLVNADLTQSVWHFELVMDYGDHEGDAPGVDATASWPVRPDPFSSYRAGFEVRTYRRCRRFLMFHRFDELGPEPRLVRALTLDYDDFIYPPGADTRSELEHAGSTRIGSFLRRATVTGYADNGLARSMPPLELSYSRPHVSDECRTLDPASVANLPAGVDGFRHQWLDLNSEGIPGILSEQGDAWWYKPNLGQGQFGPQVLVATRPAMGLEGRTHFLDLAGDGTLDLVQFHRPSAGFYERDANTWDSFTPFTSQLNVEWDDPNLRLVDLTGDGHADVLITEDDTICWHPSLAEAGFGPRDTLRMPVQEGLGPRFVFNDTTETIFLADMTGDGLADLVRVRNGEICYWPSLGYGRFGGKIVMDDSPVFDAPELFEPHRIRLADIDGSGTVDIIYLAADGVRLYFNRTGNGWSKPFALGGFPSIDNVADVTVADLLGNGTACLVWSTPLPAHIGAPLQYLDLMGGQKPHLLVGVENNLGARTRIQYATSTKFYLEDREADRPWLTRLPFPVHVVERTEIFDDISRNRFTTRFAYRHGYFDGVEREFRGFGMVEQFDTEELASLNADQQLGPASNIDAASHVPPTLTRSWFHTGVHVDDAHVSNFHAGFLDQEDAGEYYREHGLTDEQARRLLLDDSLLPPGLTAEESREACRALKGALLRQETYALDGTAREPHPYAVTEQSYAVRLVQPMGANPHAVFLVQPRESLTYHYERVPSDPRVTHVLTLEVDAFGNVLKSATLAYGRREPDASLQPGDQSKQAELHIVYAENAVTNSIESDDAHLTPLPCESRTYEVTGLNQSWGRLRFTFDEVLSTVASAEKIAYEQLAKAGSVQKRLIGHERTLFRRNDLTGVLPLGQLESLAIPFESFQLALTPGLIAIVFGTKVTDAMLAENGGYVHSEEDDCWWVPSGQVFFSIAADEAAITELTLARQHFFMPRRYRDPFGHDTLVRYEYDLLPLELEDALGNRTTAGDRDDTLPTDHPDRIRSRNDFRVLQPRLLTDPNGNRTAMSFDALGMVVGGAAMGKANDVARQGDLLDDFEPDLADDVIAAHLADPLADPQAILVRTTTRFIYDLFAYARSKDQVQPAPAVVYMLARETHDADLGEGTQTKVQHSFSYSDGFGREMQKKIQAEPGPAPLRHSDGKILLDTDGQPLLGSGHGPRWVGSGWTIFNNKGKPVRQFEPFFSDTHHCEFDVRVGVSPIVFYDPAERVIGAVHPDHTWEKVVFDAWRRETWDGNDTVLIEDPSADFDVGAFFQRLPANDYSPTWHARRAAGDLGAAEQDAATKTAAHARTPAIAHADSLGRTFQAIAHNRFERNGAIVEEHYRARITFDIEGNQREVYDANDRMVVHYDYDLLGNRIHRASMEAGERWTLANVAGNAIAAWDSRQHQFRTAYDPLQRPTETYLRPDLGPELLIGRTIYGENQPDAAARNQRGKAVRHFDQAGVVVTEDYDFKGNLLATGRQLAREYKQPLDWSRDMPLEPEVHVGSSRFDALNRPIAVTTPDGSEYVPTFNEANLLETVNVRLRGAPAATAFVADIDYNAKGQRVLIEYGNGVRTESDHDPLTFRLRNLKTTRAADHALLQDLTYTHDPAGNITHIDDAAQETLFFNNAVVTPSNDYAYDAIYRLIRAEGREHIGQASQPQTTWNDGFRTHLPHPGDGQTMRRYVERYDYDAVGNFLRILHQAPNGNWTRTYAYNEPSLLEPGAMSNRLSNTTIGDGVTEPYTHDAHGNMTAMPHLTLMQWDFADQLQATSRQIVNDGTPETTYYVYDAGGQRARKVTERQNGTRKSERRYLGGFEIYREYAGDGVTITLERETLHVMDDKERIALVETRIQGNDGSPAQLVRYQMSNHLGSSTLELDDAGQIISYEEYYPYGSTANQAVRSQTEADKRCRYSGMEKDEETGFTYHGARYYAPWMGRWMAPDPSGLVEGTNLYWYVRANPAILIDPTGQDGTPGPAYQAAQDFLKMLGVGEPAAVAPAAVAPAAIAPAVAAPTVAGASSALPMAGTVAPTVAGGMGAIGIVGVVGAGAAILGTGALQHFRMNSISQYGNPWGLHGGSRGLPLAGGGPYPLPLPYRKPEPTPEPQPAPQPAPPQVPKGKQDPKTEPGPKPKPTSPPKRDPKPENRRRRKEFEIHHIAGHQNKYSAQFAAIFANATLPGQPTLGLDDPVNLVPVKGHKGPHGDPYSKIIAKRLSGAVAGLKPHTSEYHAALLAELGDLRLEVNDPKSPLYKMVRTPSWPEGDEVNKMSPHSIDKELQSIGNAGRWESFIDYSIVIHE